MAEIVRYLNGASAGGDGTTNALSGPNAAYATFAAWQAGEATDLVAAGDNHVLYWEGATALGVSNIDNVNWNTSDTNDIKIIGDNLTGKWDTAYAHISAGQNNNGVLQINIPYVKLYNVQVENSNGANFNTRGIQSNVGNITIDSCIVKMSGGAATPGSFCAGIYFTGTGSGNKYIVNNTVFGVYGKGIYLYDNGVTDEHIVYNNTIVGDGVNSTNGIQDRGGTVAGVVYRVFNNICQGHVSADFLLTGVDATGGNISEDATSPEVGLRNITLNFVDAANDDYHLAASDTSAIGAGTDQTPSHVLGLLVAPLYAWLYKRTGDSTYQVFGDKVWEGGIGPIDSFPLSNGKQFNQMYRWSFKYVEWRS